MTRDRPTGGPPPASGGGPRAEAPAVEQPFDGQSLYVLRATLEAHAIQAGLPEGRTADLVLAVHELATNVVLHGSGAGTVRMWIADGSLECHVADPAATSPRAGVPGWPYEHGHGLWVVRALGDAHTVSSGPEGTVATVAFALPRPHRPPFRMARDDGAGRTTLRLYGSLDRRAALDLVNAVHAELAGHAATGHAEFGGGPPRRLVLDLTGMTSWDSDGIAALLTAQEHVNAAPGTVLILSGASGEFRRRLDSLSLTSLTYEDPAD